MGKSIENICLLSSKEKDACSIALYQSNYSVGGTRGDWWNGNTELLHILCLFLKYRSLLGKPRSSMQEDKDNRKDMMHDGTYFDCEAREN